MKLKKFLKMVDEVDDIIIWIDGNDDEADPAYKGSILNIPYYLLGYKLATNMVDYEKPISIVYYENKYGNKMAAYNVILKEE